MPLSETVLIALALAVDAFTVGAAVGLHHRSPRQQFRLSFHFGLFQALLPVVGAFTGTLLYGLVESFSHWVAFILLAIIGGKMVWEGMQGEDREFPSDPTRGGSLVLLSLAVSIDALAVGFTMGLQEVSILLPVVIIGVVAAACTWVGMVSAGKIAGKLGFQMEPVAGLVLIGLGVKAVVAYYWV